jgi:hypothetical protein
MSPIALHTHLCVPPAKRSYFLAFIEDHFFMGLVLRLGKKEVALPRKVSCAIYRLNQELIPQASSVLGISGHGSEPSNLHLFFQKRHGLPICKYWETTLPCSLQGVNLLNPLPAEPTEAARQLPNPPGGSYKLDILTFF